MNACSVLILIIGIWKFFQENLPGPVESFLKYLSKLDKGIPALWQRPVDSMKVGTTKPHSGKIR
jgi:hypothetical protein